MKTSKKSLALAVVLSLGVCANAWAAQGTGAVQVGGGNTDTGSGANATGVNSIAIGNSTGTGHNETVTDRSIAIGTNATAGYVWEMYPGALYYDTDAIAMGTDANAVGRNSIALGSSYKNPYTGATVNTFTHGTDSIAFGTGAYVYGDSSIAIGDNAIVGDKDISAHSAVAIGDDAKALGGCSVSVGEHARSTGDLSSAFGHSAQANGYESSAFGAQAIAETSYSTAVGTGTYTGKDAFGAVAVGARAIAEAEGSVAIGGVNQSGITCDSKSIARAGGKNSLAMGTGANAYKENSNAIGYKAHVNGENSIAIGASAKVGFYEKKWIEDDTEAGGHYDITDTHYENAIAFGNSTEVAANDSIAFGSNASAYGKNSVAIGAKSTVSDTQENVVSVGAKDAERRIINVDKAMTDTDALTSMNFTKYEDTATNKKYATHLVIDDKQYILGGVVDTKFDANSTNAIANGTVTNAFDTKVGDNNYATSPNYVTNNTSATKAIGDLDNALKNEANEREAADKDLQNQINNLGGNLAGDVERLDSDVKSVGAMAAAMAGLHPRFTGDGKGEIAAAIGSYDGKKATAIGAFYAPDERFMFSLGGAFAAGGKKMANLGVNIALDPKPHVNKKFYEQEISDLKAQVNMLMQRLAALEAKK